MSLEVTRESMEPTILDHLPDGLLDCSADQLHTRLSGPTIIHLPGRRPQPLFVCVLQHGNEISGWEATRRLLKGRYARDPLPRSLMLLIANVRAASRHQRHLTDQPDFNRCWPGSDTGPSPWHELFRHVTDHARALEPFASIDVHNNTGENPHYAAVNAIEPQRLRLAALFSRTVIYFTQPQGVQSMAFGRFCPAVTLECGPPGKLAGTDHAMTYLDTVLNLEHISGQPPAPEDIELFRMVATLYVAADHSFSFVPDASNIVFRPDLDQLNFRELPPGTRLASINVDTGEALRAITHDGANVSRDWFGNRNGDIVTRRPMMPAMLTTDAGIIRQDCLCYLMERVAIGGRLPDEPIQSRELPESSP